ncbi:MAG: DoxX family protein [Patescibacteria group bacterium]
MPSLFPALFTFSEAAPFLLRVALAALFIPYGYKKLFADFPSVLGVFKSTEWQSAPPSASLRSGWRAPSAGIAEFFGGLFLLAGFLTQLVSLLLAAKTLADIVKGAKEKRDISYRQGFSLVLLAALLSLALLGPGIYSIDLPF